MFVVKMFLKFFKILNAEAEPWQIAAGFVVGLFFGLTPLVSLHNLLLLFLLFFVRINFTSALVSWGLFSAASFFTAEVSHRIGWYLLTRDALAPTWRFLSETPVLALFNFNNTVTLGSLLLCIGAAPVVFPAVLFLVTFYRTRLKEKVEKWKIVKIIKMTKLARLVAAARRTK